MANLKVGGGNGMWDYVVCLVPLVLVINVATINGAGEPQPQVPCYFIFGDSLLDNGNNNHLNTTAKVNFPPYGIDFPQGPSGRFSNGRNMADFIAELLGFESFIPPFVAATGRDILRGVNYASGGSGILKKSGQNLGEVICLDEQLKNHKVTVSRIANLLGNAELAKDYMRECLYTVGMGSNDYINNYFAPDYFPTSRLFTPEQYASLLVKRYSRQIKTLYKYGARKISIFAAGQIGCTPAEMATFPTTNGSACVGDMNDAVSLFNEKVKVLVDHLNDIMADANILYVDTAAATSNGITVLTKTCCKTSSNLGKGQCVPGDVPCSNRDAYYFWDGFHPTEAVNQIAARIAYTAMSPLYTSPVDVW